jgi:hypothetical protein
MPHTLPLSQSVQNLVGLGVLELEEDRLDESKRPSLDLRFASGQFPFQATAGLDEQQRTLDLLFTFGK